MRDAERESKMCLRVPTSAAILPLELPRDLRRACVFLRKIRVLQPGHHATPRAVSIAEGEPPSPSPSPPAGGGGRGGGRALLHLPEKVVQR